MWLGHRRESSTNPYIVCKTLATKYYHIGVMQTSEEKVSISLSVEVLERVDRAAKEENRKRSNYIDTILRKHFKMEEALNKPYAKFGQ